MIKPGLIPKKAKVGKKAKTSKEVKPQKKQKKQKKQEEEAAQDDTKDDTKEEETPFVSKKEENMKLLLDAEQYRRGKAVCWDKISAYSVIRGSCSMSTVCFLLLRMSKQGRRRHRRSSTSEDETQPVPSKDNGELDLPLIFHYR